MSQRQEIITRHTLPIRVTHWVNALVLLVLIMSGLQIFNAHPALNFGSKTDFEHPLIAMEPMQQGDKVVGVTTLFGCSGSLARRTKVTTRVVSPGRLRCPAIAICRWGAAGISFSPGRSSSTGSFI
jgi:hypothetical protein